MKFVHPAWLAWLWLAPAVFGLAALGIRRRARQLRRYAQVPSRIARGRHEARRWQGAALLALAVGSTAVAMAGPQLGFHWRTTERRGVDLVVAVDCSRSMLATDVNPSRLDRAKREVVDLLNRLEGDRVGLVAFAGTAFLQCPLTLDYAGLHLFLQTLTPSYLPVGGTALDAALATALAAFDPESPADRAIILITDGEETTGAVAAAAQRAVETNTRVYVVGIGTPEGAPVPLPEGGFVKDPAGRIVLARLGEEALADLASRTGGSYARSVPGDEDWQVIYDRGIRAELEAQTLEAERVQVWHDRYQWPLLLAVLALVAELLIPSGRRAAALAVLGIAAGLSWPGEVQAESASALVRRGLERYHAGDYAGAEQAFVGAQVIAPSSPEVAFDLGNAQYRAGKFEDALASYSAALGEVGPELRPQVLYNRGNAAYRLGRLEDAMRDYEAALAVDPGDREARLNLEFARQRLEQQRQEPEQTERQPGPEQNEGEDREPQTEPGAAGNEGKEDAAPRPQPEQDTAQDAGQPEGQGEQPAAAPALEEPARDPGGGDEQAAIEDAADGRSPPGEAPETMGPLQARNLLNRLEDQPGKALMPRYQKRHIEKDW